MEIFLKIVITVLPVFAIMGAGACYGRYKSLPAQSLSDLMLWILLPCLVLGSLGGQSIESNEFFKICASAVLIVTGTGLLSYFAFYSIPERRALLLPSMFMNSANMAFPLALFAFSDAGLSRQVVFYLAIHILHVTLGMAIARGRGGWREVFRYPLIYTAGIAVFFNLANLQIPTSIAQPLNLVGRATLPIMLLLLGARLGSAKLQHFKLSLLSTLVRLGGGFVLGWMSVWIFDLDGMAEAAVMLGAVMPAAVFNYVLSEKYDLYPQLMASTVAISTLISIVTTPLFMYYVIL